MRNFIASLISLLLLSALVYFSFARLQPDASYNGSGFDMDKAFSHVQEIGKKAHPVGTAQHGVVRQYIVRQLQDMGLQVQTQEGYSLTDNGTLVKPINIISRIEGTDTDAKALLLLSHYDSNPHSSKGASDAGSGVATILEGLRAFLENQSQHKNDIIILFTDAEELGLNGAELFVNDHEWAKDVGLALNFEARGSGGPSNMIVETNGGNTALITAFEKAKVQFPVASSLSYSVYKLLPNDTDSTVFREDGDIDSFFFAFLDDHYDYHTALDTPKRLDKRSLAHQASYLMPLLNHFSTTNLENLTAETDDVYFDLPFSIIVHYPFSWVFPMLISAVVLFIILLIYGFKKKRLTGKGLFTGFLAFIVALAVSGLVTFYGWSLLKVIYPQYTEMLHKFTYNAHDYIAAFVLLTIGVLWLVYRFFGKKLSTPDLMVAPLFIWLLLCFLISVYLKGAAYFIIPVGFALFSFWLCIFQKRPLLLLLVLINALAIVIFTPLIRAFPVALDLNMMAVSAVLSVLLFGMLLSIFNFYKQKKLLGYICLAASLVFFVKAHLNSGFTKDHPKPNSLVYSVDFESNKANWFTYDTVLDDWTKQVLGEAPEKFQPKNTFSSKYNSKYTFSTPAKLLNLPKPSISISKTDTTSAESISYTIKIAPNRPLSRMEIYTKDKQSFKSFSAHGLSAGDVVDKGISFNKYTKRWSNHVLTYYVTDMDTLRLNVETDKTHNPEFILYEASNDLLKTSELPIIQRTKTMIPKPFILNDAIITKSVFDLSRPEIEPLKSIDNDEAPNK